MTDWLEAFALTVALEVPLVWVLLGRFGAVRVLAVAVIAQVLTHPALWFCAPRFEPYLAWVAVMEAVVVAVEALWFALWLRRWDAPHAWIWAVVAALVANAVSTLFGLWRYGLL